MSGSSSSRIQAVEPVVDEPSLERLADGERGQRLEAGPRRAVELHDRRQDQVELLGDDVGDRLAAQRRVEDVRGDLGVEGDRRRRGVGVVGDPGDEQRLDLVTDHRDLEPIEQPAQRAASSGPSTATVRPSVPATARASGEPRRGRGSSSRSPTPTAGCAASQGSRAAIRSPAGPRSATGRRSRPPAPSAGRPAGRPVGAEPRGCRGRPARPVRRAVVGSADRADRVEIERQLEPAALRRRPTGRAGPTRRPGGAGDARRRHRTVGRDAAQSRGRVAGRLAGHRRQALDERAELVLAEEPDDRLAVVVAEPRRLEVERRPGGRARSS